LATGFENFGLCALWGLAAWLITKTNGRGEIGDKEKQRGFNVNKWLSENLLEPKKMYYI
jgi:hypothetical protein